MINFKHRSGYHFSSSGYEGGDTARGSARNADILSNRSKKTNASKASK